MVVFGSAHIIHNADTLFRILFEMTITDPKIAEYLARQKLVERLICFLHYFIYQLQIEDENFLYVRLPVETKEIELHPVINPLGWSSDDSEDKVQKRIQVQTSTQGHQMYPVNNF